MLSKLKNMFKGESSKNLATYLVLFVVIFMTNAIGIQEYLNGNQPVFNLIINIFSLIGTVLCASLVFKELTLKDKLENEIDEK